MQKPAADQPPSALSPVGAAVGGVVVAVLGGLLLAQAGGSDREMFLSLGLALEAVGLLEIIVGGVALGVRMARD